MRSIFLSFQKHAFRKCHRKGGPAGPAPDGFTVSMPQLLCSTWCFYGATWAAGRLARGWAKCCHCVTSLPQRTPQTVTDSTVFKLLQIQLETGSLGNPPTPSASDLTLELDRY